MVTVEFHGVWENLVYDSDIKEKVNSHWVCPKIQVVVIM